MLATALDRSSPGDLQTLAEVERTLASGVRGLRFTDALEQRYQLESLEPRRQFLTGVGLSGAVIYELFLISDWLSMRDVFVYLAVSRVCLMTPLFILLILWSQRMTSRRGLEVAATFGTTVAALMPTLVMLFSESPYRLNYQMGGLLLMVFCSMIQQLPARYAAVALGCMLTFNLIVTYLCNITDATLWDINFLLYLSTALLLGMASYFLEYGSRMSYLFALRGRLLEVRLLELARTDPLTRLYNRRYLGEVTAAIWQRAEQTPVSVSVVLMDIDHFKAYNDNYGHPQGDTCLRQLSDAIQSVARETGALAFRFGGEEMLVVAINSDAEAAQTLAEHLRAAVYALAIPHPVLGTGARVTISLGAASAMAPQTGLDTLIADADDALYAAKRAGRDCLRLAPTGAHEHWAPVPQERS